MKMIISPAKRMEKYPRPLAQEMSAPEFLEEAEYLFKDLSHYSPWQLESALKTGEELAFRAHEFYQEPKSVGAALFAYQGLAFSGIEPESLSKESLSFLASQLLILSPLYGVLRPFDEIYAHRLELQCKYRIEGESLYRFWGEKVYRSVFSDGEIVLNLASGEYSKMIARHIRPGDPLVHCDFLTLHKGKYKTLATYAKMARGRMVRFIAKNKIKEINGLSAFEWDGFRYSEARSTGSRLCFVRD